MKHPLCPRADVPPAGAKKFYFFDPGALAANGAWSQGLAAADSKGMFPPTRVEDEVLTLVGGE